MATSDYQTPSKGSGSPAGAPSPGREKLPWNIGQTGDVVAPSGIARHSPSSASPRRDNAVGFSPRNAQHELAISELNKRVRMVALENRTLRNELQAALRREQRFIELLKEGNLSAATATFERRLADLTAEKEDALAKLVQLSLESEVNHNDGAVGRP